MAADEQREFLEVGQVARLGEVSVATVRSWEAAGKLAARRTAGGQRLFERADVEIFLAARRARRTRDKGAHAHG